MAFAQKKTISGKVVDIDGAPLEMVIVNVVGTNVVAYTDLNGAYSISAAPKDTLAFSMLGYHKRAIRVGDKKTLNVTMEETGANRIADLIVVGYSKVERRDLTGSVASVKPNENISFQSVDQMLQGQAPGVFMSNSSGALGSANVLTIRGISSIMGDNNPLYVIDGVPVYGTDRDANSVGTSGGSIPGASMSGMQTGGGSLTYNYDLKNSFEKKQLNLQSEISLYITESEVKLYTEIDLLVEDDIYLDSKEMLTSAIQAKLAVFKNKLDEHIKSRMLVIYSSVKEETGFAKVQEEIHTSNIEISDLQLPSNCGEISKFSTLRTYVGNTMLGGAVGAALGGFGTVLGLPAVSAKIGAICTRAYRPRAKRSSSWRRRRTCMA